MADQNDRWNDRSDDRYGGGGDWRGAEGRPTRFGQSYDDRPVRGYGAEGRAFDQDRSYPSDTDRTTRASGHGRGDYGEEDYNDNDSARGRVGDRDRGDYRDDGYDTDRAANAPASKSMLHQGYRSGFGQNDQEGYRGSFNPSERYGRGQERSSGEGRGLWDQTRDEVSSWFGDSDAQRRREADQTATGPHRGKGPKGYARSDDRIKEDVSDRLTDDHSLDASDIEVSVASGEVTLNGLVASRQDKRLAEDLVEQISSVKHVQNNLRVKDGAAGGQSAGQGGQATSLATSLATGSTGAQGRPQSKDVPASTSTDDGANAPTGLADTSI